MRLASLNVWGLPWPASREGGERMLAIGAQLPALALDIAAFQEVWTEGARRSLQEAGRRAGLVHVWQHGAALGGSGLFVLSRAPIADARFEAFSLRGFPQRVWHGDYQGGKGFCLLRYAGPDGSFTLIDTHLHAQYVEDERDDAHPHRVGQIVQLAAAIAARRDPVVAAGDFNMREGRPEYDVFVGLTGMRDAAAELDRREPTTLLSNPYRIQRGARLEERIDYVFTREGDGRSVRVRSLERIFDTPPARGPAGYSDHAGLVADLEFAADAGSRVPIASRAALELAGSVLRGGLAAAESRRDAQRLTAAGALVGGALAISARRRPALSRRRLLRGGLAGAALLALPVGFANGALAEVAYPDELRAFAAVADRLAGFATQGAARKR